MKGAHIMPQEKLNVDSLEEAANDLFCFIILLEAKRHQNDKTAKYYIALFLKQIVPVMEYEFSQLLEQTTKLDKSKFYTSSQMKKRVEEERQRSLKEAITQSKNLATVSESMGLNFEEKTYDIRISLHREQLLQINYENFKDEIGSLDFWDALFRSPQKLLDAIFFILFDNKYTVDDFIKSMKQSIENLALLFDQNFSNTEYAYSAYKLFPKKLNLNTNEKIFILYRYRYVSSIIYIEQAIDRWLNKSTLGNEYLRNMFKNFFRKWKAVIIEALHNDLKNTDLAKMQEKLDTAITNPSGFMLNRKIRNNIHYSKVEKLPKKDILTIDSFQKIYFNVMLQYFQDALFIDIDKQCRTMTAFLLECANKDISEKELEKNYYYYFLKYKLFHHL